MDMLNNPVVLAGIVVVAVGYVVVRRTVGEPLNARDLVVAPLILLLLGVRHVADGDLTPGQITAMAGIGLVAVVLGGVRAATVQLYLRDGAIWYQYRGVTWAAWAVTAVVGAAIRLGGYEWAHLPASARSYLLSTGLTLAGESIALAWRGLASGNNFAAEGRDAASTRRVVHGEIARRFSGAPRRR